MEVGQAVLAWGTPPKFPLQGSGGAGVCMLHICAWLSLLLAGPLGLQPIALPDTVWTCPLVSRAVVGRYLV